jgi:hypothetical protein
MLLLQSRIRHLYTVISSKIPTLKQLQQRQKQQQRLVGEQEEAPKPNANCKEVGSVCVNPGEQNKKVV